MRLRMVAVPGLSLVLLAAGVATAPPASALVQATVISSAQYPLGLDVDAAGNVWIGYESGPMTPKGVTVVPAASGTVFGVAVTAGLESRIFDLSGIQGILMSPDGTLFVATEAGVLYAATEENSTVFGIPTTADTLTQISTGGFFRAGLAMDAAGNLFSALKFQDGGGVGVMPAVTGLLYGQAVTANTPAKLQPPGVTWGGWDGDLALDSQGNLFVNQWFTTAKPNGVYVLAKATGTIFGQSVVENTLTQLPMFTPGSFQAAGIDIDAADNLYVSRYNGGNIWLMSPVTREVMGQAATANVAAVLSGSAGNASQGVAVAADGSFLASGPFASTRRLVPVPAPTISAVYPSAGPVTGGTSVTISGTNLTGTSSVTFGGVAATAVTVVDSTTVTATTQARTAGTVTVSLTTPGGTVSLPEAFTYSDLPLRIPPGPPVDVRATPLTSGARVTWSAPAYSGTDALYIYAVRAWPGGPVCQLSAATTSCDVSGLEPEVDYYFTVVAMSGAGWGDASAPSNSVRPLVPSPPSTPLAVSAEPGNTQATVTWSPPVDEGSSPVVEYRVTSVSGEVGCTTGTLSCVITGLVNGAPYNFRVEARNDAGWGPASDLSPTVIPDEPSLALQGERAGRRVMVAGSSTGLAVGTPVTLWVRLSGETDFRPSLRTVVVGPGGGFSWERQVSPSRSVEVYAAVGDLTSEVLTISSP